MLSVHFTVFTVIFFKQWLQFVHLGTELSDDIMWSQPKVCTLGLIRQLYCIHPIDFMFDCSFLFKYSEKKEFTFLVKKKACFRIVIF